MRNSIKKLFDIAADVKTFLEVYTFTCFWSDEDSYIDFRVSAINNTQTLWHLCSGLKFKIFADGDKLVIRIYEENIPE